MREQKKFEVEIVRKATLTVEDIDDIMCGALEGGITYWCSSAEIVEKDYLAEFASEQISRGGSLRLYDAEEDKQYVLTLDKFLTGFKKACESGYGNDWFDDNGGIDTCQIDAIGCDAIVQCALFGEVIYG